ncbi:MAG: hypothetical protein K2Y25_07015 [Pseudomonadaceae bacterium]|nr:hypothetical protein [Pseudomonadaceae bacterium]
MGQLWAILSIGVLVVVVLVLAVCVQTLRVYELAQMLSCYTNAWERLRADLNSQAKEIRRLQSALRAERAHVAQLQRKVLLVQGLLDKRVESEVMQTISTWEIDPEYKK